MKTDLYLRVVLTIIAICLTLNILKEFNIITPVQAQSSSTLDVNIKSVGGRYIQGTVPVTQKQY